ncbi:MAG: sensor histidine kinase [Culicoidibacterales bacterium]
MKDLQKKTIIIYSLLAILAFFQLEIAFILLLIFSFSCYITYRKQQAAQKREQDYLKSLSSKSNQKLIDLQTINQKQLQILVDTIGTPLFLIETSLKITLTNTPFSLLFPQNHLSPNLQQFINNTLLLEQPQTATLKINKSYYKIIATPVKLENNNYFGSIFILTDVTDHKQLEIAQKTFISHASHELKTPLTVIQGAAKIINQDPKNSKTNEFSQMILEEAKQMNAIITNLINLTSLQTQPNTLKLQTHSITQLITQTIKRLAQKAKQKATLINFQDTNEHRLKIDHVKIEQVLLNILDNAIKYSSTDSIINITCLDQTTHLQIDITNQAEPIKQQNRQKIFLPFYRINTKTPGTGLGLAIAKEIIELHKGKITVSSNKISQTNTFSVFLPKIDTKSP